jgi:hypothetical protein
MESKGERSRRTSFVNNMWINRLEVVRAQNIILTHDSAACLRYNICDSGGFILYFGLPYFSTLLRI